MKRRARANSFGGDEGGKAGGGDEGRTEKDGSLRRRECSGIVVLPSMAETVQRLLADAGIEKRDERVVHLLVDLLQRATLDLLADATQIADYRQNAAARPGSSEKRQESAQARLPPEADSDQRGGGRAAPSRAPASMCIEEEDAKVAVQEYTQRYVVQPNVVLDGARLCSLSNSLACGQSSAAELILHRATAPGGSARAGASTCSLFGESFALLPVENSASSAAPSGPAGVSGGAAESTFPPASGGGFGPGASPKASSAGESGGAFAAAGAHAIVANATNKNVLGSAPQGLPPYLPEDVSVSTLLPSWSLRLSACSSRPRPEGADAARHRRARAPGRDEGILAAATGSLGDATLNGANAEEEDEPATTNNAGGLDNEEHGDRTETSGGAWALFGGGDDGGDIGAELSF
ncbi:hypothetical protein BESB_006270 [Besnoitia besnoiti]|uniref:Uncharacterized protein n=1 Tax=Besnoitia besnoiti TaxID=94643 RepID=A0A2A9MPK2_BESBE|nr:hypothetical protein BESB_006270 [Besnoitia besnoiti]PFH38286.1 hypothetical protein BESB_006270 [Besnoitia besnoiti]